MLFRSTTPGCECASGRLGRQAVAVRRVRVRPRRVRAGAAQGCSCRRGEGDCASFSQVLSVEDAVEPEMLPGDHLEPPCRAARSFFALLEDTRTIQVWHLERTS